MRRSHSCLMLSYFGHNQNGLLSTNPHSPLFRTLIFIQITRNSQLKANIAGVPHYERKRCVSGLCDWCIQISFPYFTAYSQFARNFTIQCATNDLTCSRLWRTRRYRSARLWESITSATVISITAISRCFRLMWCSFWFFSCHIVFLVPRLFFSCDSAVLFSFLGANVLSLRSNVAQKRNLSKSHERNELSTTDTI